MVLPFKGLFGLADRMLERALDGVALRQRVTAHNLANIDTPGYKRQTVRFEETLKAALAREPNPRLVGRLTHPAHIPIGGPARTLDRPWVPERDDATTMRNDGNNVDVEQEMAQLIKDEVYYNVVAQQVAKRYSMLRDAITEGRR